MLSYVYIHICIIFSWQVDQVLDVDFMFDNASSFVSDLSSWALPNTVTLCVDFNLNGQLTLNDLPLACQ